MSPHDTPPPATATRPRAGLLHQASSRVLAGGLALLLAILGSALALVWRELEHARQRDSQHLQLLADVLDAQASQVFDSSRLALDSLAHGLQQSALTLERWETLLDYHLQSLPYVRSLALLDLKGNVLASTPAAEAVRIDLQRLLPAGVADERMLVAPWAPGRSLSEYARRAPSSPAAGAGFIPLARGARTAQGQPVLLLALLNPDALAIYQRQLLDASPPGTQALLLLEDGTLLSQAGDTPQPLGTNLRLHPLFTQPPSHKGRLGPLPTPHGDSLLAWRRAASHPLVSVVEQPYAATVQHWRHQLRGPLAFMALGLLLLAAMTTIAWRNARAREQAQRERDEAVHATARREQELSLLFKSVQELIFRTDAHGAIRLVNARWQELAQQPPELARGRQLHEVVLPDSREAVAALFRPGSAAEGVRTAQALVPGPGGETRTLDISVVPLRDRAGRLRGFAGSAMDVTALLAAQQRLHEQLDLTRQLLDANPLPIGLVDMQGRFLSINPAWEELMGLRREQVLGLRSVDFLPLQEAQAWDAHNDELLHTGEPVRYQERLQRPDGSARHVQVTKVCLRAPSGKPSGVLVVKMDITDFLAACTLAQRAAHTQREFVANISHELRTPLQSILGFSELGVARASAHAKLAGMFETIHGAGQRMLALVNDLLDLAKIESNIGAFHFQRHDVRDIAEAVAAELQPQLQGRQLQLRLQLGSEPLQAKIDPARFAQVLRNVLANAIKFSPPGGAIDLDASQPDPISIRLSVRDHGPGIPPAELENIFQAFEQSSLTRDGSGGTGLGLTICRKIMASHGGHIAAAPAPDGALFHITLPTAEHINTMPAPLQ
ncbi:PAS domain-containing protein [Alicycliphilus denitrificans]|uniref:PAS domain-containing protein n=1 Tax=Alicycliphilus denitrificans TaxID=179636 RepID=UPI003850E5A4